MLVARNYQSQNLVRLLPVPGETLSSVQQEVSRTGTQSVFPHQRKPASGVAFKWNRPQQWWNRVRSDAHPEAKDPLYLFACQLEWEQSADTGAGWELIAAANSSHADTRAYARSLLECSLKTKVQTSEDAGEQQDRPNSTTEAGMKAPYGLEIIESCIGCKASREGFFCRFSQPVMRLLNSASHHTVMPAGAVLFVEGQTARGVFIVCSGKVKLLTTSKDGRVLVLKQAHAGEVLGLSAAVTGTSYEMTAETASACQLNFIGRQDFMAILQKQSEVGVHASLWLSREFQDAYRDIHDLVLARSSSGKLARLLLSSAHPGPPRFEETRLRSVMTHEEMAQRIGSSRETVTRLLTRLKKKNLIRLDGAMLVIRDRPGLEAMAV